MKIKAINDILIIDFLTVFLILLVVFVPSNPVRSFLALPFILFFPGYTLVCALVVGTNQSGVEKLALSFGMSIAVVVLVGLCLNYSPWGVRLESILYSLTFFILLMSVLTLTRRARISRGRNPFATHYIEIPRWGGSVRSKLLTVVLAIAVLAAASAAGYAFANPKTGQQFSEFYLLDLNRKTQDYPSQILLRDGQAIEIGYGTNDPSPSSDGLASVYLGIINHEKEPTAYVLQLVIDGTPSDFTYASKPMNALSLQLVQEEQWEGKIDFAPQHTGDNQKVEFQLLKNGNDKPDQNLYFWISVK